FLSLRGNSISSSLNRHNNRRAQILKLKAVAKVLTPRTTAMLNAIDRIRPISQLRVASLLLA
ncbi:hypothetical protein, partial [Vibrio cholerae]|uniref:hypothetical protein n=1 Tax=Vibrio cholerae TaxID=666 RepID=UPI001F1E6599